MPDKFIDHKTQEAQIKEAGLDKESIFNVAIKLLDINGYISTRSENK